MVLTCSLASWLLLSLYLSLLQKQQKRAESDEVEAVWTQLCLHAVAAGLMQNASSSVSAGRQKRAH